MSRTVTSVILGLLLGGWPTLALLFVFAFDKLTRRWWR